MPNLEPFVALRYDPSVAGPLDALVAPPYDVIAPAEEQRLLDASPYNVVRLEGSTAECGEAEHRRAAELLRDWRAEGVLVPTPPAIFAYEMRAGGADGERTTRGLLAGLEIEPWGGAVLPHEEVSRKPLGERLGRLRTVRANLSPIHVVLPGPSPRLSSFLATVIEQPPLAEVQDDGSGVRHRAWATHPDAAVLEEIAGQRCMIADGHHRYTTALAYRDEMRSAEGPGPWDHVLAFVAVADGSSVLPFHRVVLEGSLPEPEVTTPSLEQTLAELDDDGRRVGIVRHAGAPGVTYGILSLTAPPPAVEALEPMLPRSEDAVRYVADPREADALVRSGSAAGAWLLPPTTAARVREAVDAGRRLPRKSTYFWPKPRTGFVLRPLD